MKFVFYLILRISTKNTFIDLFGFTYYLLSIPSATAEKTEVLYNSTDITKALMGFYAKKIADMTITGLPLNLHWMENLVQSIEHYLTSRMKVLD
jgi:hypothetical protein